MFNFNCHYRLFNCSIFVSVFSRAVMTAVAAVQLLGGCVQSAEGWSRLVIVIVQAPATEIEDIIRPVVSRQQQ